MTSLPVPAFPRELATRWGLEEAISAHALMRLAREQRALIARLGEGHPDLALHREVLELLDGAVRRETNHQAVDPRHLLHGVFANWDLFAVDAAPSHRGKVLGPVVQLTKRAALRTVRPVHVELLRPQRAFNLEFAKLEGTAFETRTPKARREVLEQVRAVLVPLKDPMRFEVRSHRAGVLGRSTDALKRSTLAAVVPHLRPILDQLHAFNSAALALLELYLTDDAEPLSALHERLAALQALGEPPSAAALSFLGRAAQPLWAEIFRKQSAFANAVRVSLAAAFGVPRPADNGKASGHPELVERAERLREAEVIAKLPTVARRPLISIVTPVWRTPPALLEACVGSVLDQRYDNWELILVDDGSKRPELSAHLARLGASDARVRVLALEENQGIAGATNMGIGLARGEFVAFLDHDDVLVPTTLAEFVLHLERQPETDVAYCDEDRLDAHGRRVTPFYKPDWSPELLRSVNYVCHFLIVRRSVLESVGRLRKGFDGSQDYELILRLSERTSRFAHLPHLLYRWREAPNSTASDLANKPHATHNGVKALEEHLARLGESARVESPSPTHYRVRYPVPAGTTTTVVVLDTGGPDQVRGVLTHVRQASQGQCNLVVASTRARPAAGLEASTGWFSAPSLSEAVDRAVGASRDAVVTLLHDHVEIVDAQWLIELTSQALRKEIGAVGPKLVAADQTIASLGLVLPLAHPPLAVFAHLADHNAWSAFGQVDWCRNVSAVPSCALTFRRQLWSPLRFQQLGLAEGAIAFCADLRRAGLRIVATPWARVLHRAPSHCLDAALTMVGSEEDPYYNVNLSKTRCNGALSDSSR